MVDFFDDDEQLKEAELAFKRLVVDAICGVGFPSTLLAQECEKAGLAVFIGNSYDPQGWIWRREQLLKCSTESLQELYEGLCDARDDATPPDPDRTSSGLVLQ